ncbi:MAG TPA: peroxiredoxin [Ktedonobacteraceae bacterium]|nr:peroxiredoxin [Ktedonobacteraceae bacterium]
MSIQDDQYQAATGKVQVGHRAPNFTLPSLDGKPVSLESFIGQKNIVLYFYPKDNTPGCIAEACAFRDSYEVFQEAGAEVIGISSDSEESHRHFASGYRLPFILLSDVGGKVRKLYGVPTTFRLLPGRVTYIIDKRGIVRHIFSAAFAPQKHVDEALKVLEMLREEQE